MKKKVYKIWLKALDATIEVWKAKVTERKFLLIDGGCPMCIAKRQVLPRVQPANGTIRIGCEICPMNYFCQEDGPYRDYQNSPNRETAQVILDILIKTREDFIESKGKIKTDRIPRIPEPSEGGE